MCGFFCLESLKVWLHSQPETIHTNVDHRSSKSPVKDINPFSIKKWGRFIIGLKKSDLLNSKI